MRSRANKPAFGSVLDLGLRDVGVKNEPLRHGAHLGKTVAALCGVFVVSTVAICVLVGLTGVGAWAALPLAVALAAAIVVVSMRMAARSPITVVKVTAEGTNQATWMLMAPFFLFTGWAVLTRNLYALPVVALLAVYAVAAWRGRGHMPALLRGFRPLLAEDETVLGDGVGRVEGTRRWHETVRLVVATDRRLLVAGSTPADEPVVLLDVPYAGIGRFGIEWQQKGNSGVLALTLAGDGGAASETHTIDGIPPANLLSIAQALQANGVAANHPAAVGEAERAWAEAQGVAGPKPPKPPRRSLSSVLDDPTMNTPQFDMGLWLLLGLGLVVFYLNPLGIGVGASRSVGMAVLIAAALCAFCGFVSGTKRSLTYLVPLNLLVAPAFFFRDASEVLAMMTILSAVAALGLGAGSALGEDKGVPAAPASAARGSLRYTLSGVGLLRLSAVMLATLMMLVLTATAAGFPLSNLRLAIEERTLEQVPVDGKSNLTGGVASVKYTRDGDLREFVTDNLTDGSETDGARWELRSSFTKGYNVVSLASYVKEPALDDQATVGAFIARKDREHSGLAGAEVTHTELVAGGRRGYVWNHGSPSGQWFYAAWFPSPVHTVRVECIAKQQEQKFRKLCREAVKSLKFHR